MSKILKITNFSKCHFLNIYIHGKVLQHENALSHILTFNMFCKKYQSNINVPKVTDRSGHWSFLTDTCPSCDH
jgi:hypothetical protein